MVAGGPSHSCGEKQRGSVMKWQSRPRCCWGQRAAPRGVVHTPLKGSEAEQAGPRAHSVQHSRFTSEFERVSCPGVTREAESWLDLGLLIQKINPCYDTSE